MSGGPRTPLGHNGVHGWRSMDTTERPMASTWAICCQGHSMSCPLFSWMFVDLQGGHWGKCGENEEASWASK